MHLSSLHLIQFKNISSQKLEFSPRINFLVGLNGVGKTNLLDAIHFLCLVRSHRSIPDKNLVKTNCDFFRLDAQMVLDEQSKRLVAKYQVGKRKEFELNGAGFSKMSDYIGTFPVVMIAPDDVSLVSEGSEERRRFLDTTISQIDPAYLDALIRYNQLLKQRNALLKTFAETGRFDPDLLGTYNLQMLEPADVVFNARKAFVTAFEPVLNTFYAAISGDKESIQMEYTSDLHTAAMSDLLASSEAKDRILQRTNKGPHKDDLDLQVDGLAAKKYASQGQLKSLLLALRLAQYELLRKARGTDPLLLLDDIFDKLDENRVKQLIGLIIQENFGQLFITDTHRDRMEQILEAFPGDHRFFEVDNGEFATTV
jgi:DNA replication and repair protein RecF